VAVLANGDLLLLQIEGRFWRLPAAQWAALKASAVLGSFTQLCSGLELLPGLGAGLAAGARAHEGGPPRAARAPRTRWRHL
jgi:hypothetical protein